MSRLHDAGNAIAGAIGTSVTVHEGSFIIELVKIILGAAAPLLIKELFTWLKIRAAQKHTGAGELRSWIDKKKAAEKKADAGKKNGCNDQ